MTCHIWVSDEHLQVFTCLLKISASRWMKSVRGMKRTRGGSGSSLLAEGTADVSSLRHLSTLRARGRSNTETLKCRFVACTAGATSDRLIFFTPSSPSPAFYLSRCESTELYNRWPQGVLMNRFNIKIWCFNGGQHFHMLHWFIQMIHSFMHLMR